MANLDNHNREEHCYDGHGCTPVEDPETDDEARFSVKTALCTSRADLMQSANQTALNRYYLSGRLSLGTI